MLQILLLCVAAALICVTLRATRPEMAAAVAMAAGLVALALSMDDVRAVIAALRGLSERAAVSQDAVGLMLRAVGVALVAEFGTQLCRDAGESALAGRVEFGARTALLAMSLPVLGSLVTRLTALLP